MGGGEDLIQVGDDITDRKEGAGAIALPIVAHCLSRFGPHGLGEHHSISQVALQSTFENIFCERFTLLHMDELSKTKTFTCFYRRVTCNV